MYLTFGYSFAHHGLNAQGATVWFSGSSGISATMTGPWINVMELHAGKRLDLHAGEKLELKAGKKLELRNG